MERALPNPRDCDRKGLRTHRRGGHALLGATVILGAVLLAGCDSVSGLPSDEPAADPATTTVTTPPAAIPLPTTVAGSTLPPVPADAPLVGAVPGLPEAAPALQRWAADLQDATDAELQAKCWTMAPANVAEMYENKQAILSALAQPGSATATAVTWKSRSVTVTAERGPIGTGYVCPRVFPAGTEPDVNDRDARHTVRRYLARFVGKPLDPADKEGTYPLVCKASPATWDPTGSGRPIPAPLANNPGRLTGVVAFDDQEISSDQLRAGYIEVEVPVTNSSGVTQTRTFTVTETADGYCIGDVSP